MSSSRVLFLPLSNVLGHLTRTFALAEQLLDQNVDVHVATNNYYSDLIKALPEGIVRHHNTEIPQASTRTFGPISSYKSGRENDLANIESANKISASELQLRSRYLKVMVDQDKEIIQKIKPDIIITDYRYTVSLFPEIPFDHIFHIANVLGYPSLYKRVRGKHFLGLERGHILAPGIRAIEQTDPEKPDDRNTHWCGPFRWKGWQRLGEGMPPPSPADIFLCFGSTGNGPEIIPWLLKTIDKHYQIVMVGDRKAQKSNIENLEVNFGCLEQLMVKSKIVCCHGGHGTVMECILHKTPMIIFPNNIEQLEIGRRIEALGLGILIDQHYRMMDKGYLNDVIDRLLLDQTIKRNLSHYSEQLKQHDGPKQAASIIFNSLTNNFFL